MKFRHYFYLFSEILVQDKHYYKARQEQLHSGAGKLLQNGTIVITK